MSRGKGQAPLRVRDTLANVSGPHFDPWNRLGQSSPNFGGLVIPEHTFPGPNRPISEAPRIPITTQVKLI